MKSVKENRIKVLQGNAACAEAAILAGCRFFAGYPITPATEIMESMARRLPYVNGICMQLEDEIAAVVSLVGASWGGKKAMTATSGPGFCLMQEGVGLAISTETPCVIVDVQRVGPSTGFSTYPSQGDVCQARFGSNGDYSIIVLAPSTAQEMFTHTILAFNFSEKYRVPVVIMTDEVVGHLREKVDFSVMDDIEIIDRKRPRVPPEQFLPFKPDEDGVPPMPAFNEGYNLMILSQSKNEGGVRGTVEEGEVFIRRIVDKIEKRVDEIALVEALYLDDAEHAVLSYGSTLRVAQYAVEDARKKGRKIGLIALKSLWPFPRARIRKLAGNLRSVMVAEMNLGMMFREVEAALCGQTPVTGFFKVGGRYPNPDEILAAIERDLK